MVTFTVLSSGQVDINCRLRIVRDARGCRKGQYKIDVDRGRVATLTN